MESPPPFLWTRLLLAEKRDVRLLRTIALLYLLFPFELASMIRCKGKNGNPSFRVGNDADVELMEVENEVLN
jgi:hypothetical protein